MILWKKVSLSFAVSRRFLQASTRCCFWSSVMSRETNFAATGLIFSFLVRISWSEPNEILNSTAISQIWQCNSSVDDDGRSERLSLLTNWSPSLNLLNHLWHIGWHARSQFTFRKHNATRYSSMKLITISPNTQKSFYKNNSTSTMNWRNNNQRTAGHLSGYVQTSAANLTKLRWLGV